MKLSELIEQLVKIEKEHGDLPVTYWNDGFGVENSLAFCGFVSAETKPLAYERVLLSDDPAGPIY